jgi:hypothetical protein
MATKIIISDFAHQMAHGVHNIGADTFRLALYATANMPATSSTTKTSTTEASSANLSGGANPVVTLDATVAGATTTVTAVSIRLTAGAGGVGPFQAYAIYNDTAISPADALVMAWDHGSSVTLADTETFDIKFNNAAVAAAGNIFTVTGA